MENNKLIAEFMEWKFVGDKYNTPHSLSRGMFTTSSYDIEQLKFHKSWDWLMPVIKKAQKIVLKTPTREMGIAFLPIYNTLLNYNIKSTHRAVVEFIKWYNENK